MFKDNSAFSSFSVTDLEAAKTFYGQTLGLETAETPEGLELRLSGGGRVFLYAKPDHVPAGFTVLNFLVQDIDQALDGLRNQGVQMEHYDNLGEMAQDDKGVVRGDEPHPGPHAIAWFKDPAGNVLAVIQEK